MMKSTLSILLTLFLISPAACGAQHSGNKPLETGDNTTESTETGDFPVITFVGDIQPLVEQRCTLCHNSNSGLPVWTDYEVIFAKKELVRARVFESQDMPRGNATNMTQEERELIALWVDQGAPFDVSPEPL